MKLVLVHGINQQAKSSSLIEKQWLQALRARAGADSAWPYSKVSTIRTPFYGDRLFALAEIKQDLSAVAQGVEDPPDDFAEFAAPALAQMAIKAGAKEEDIESEAGNEPVPQGAGPHKRLLKAAARFIEKISPFKGEIALGILGQAHAYLKRPHIMKEVDDIVRPSLEGDEPMVIIAPSR
jgi:hypothetical protein